MSNNKKKNTKPQTKKAPDKAKETVVKETAAEENKELNAAPSKGKMMVKPTGEVTLSYRTKCAYWETAAQIYAFVMCAIYPLAFAGNKYTKITETKFWYSVAFVSLFIVFSICVYLYFIIKYQKKSLRYSAGKQSLTVPQIFILAYVGWGIISAIASDYGSDVWLGQARCEGLISMILTATSFFLLSLWGEYTDWYAKCLGISGIIFGLIGLAQSFGATMIYPDGYDYWDSQFITTIGNIDFVAGFIVMAMPALICAFVYINEEDKLRWLAIPAIFLLTHILAFSGVDSGKMGMLAAFIIMAPLIFDSRDHAAKACLAISMFTFGFTFNWILNIGTDGVTNIAFGKKAILGLVVTIVLIAVYFVLRNAQFEFKYDVIKMRKLLAIAMIAVIIIGLIFVFLYNGSNTLLSQAHELMHGTLSDNAGSGRGYIWKACVKLIAENPLLGTGPGTFTSAFDPYNEGWQVFSPGVYVDSAHNELLHMGVCIGLVGVLLYLAFIGSLFVRFIKYVNRYPKMIILASAVAGYFGHSIFSISIPVITPLFWVILGLLDKCIRQASEAKVK